MSRLNLFLTATAVWAVATVTTRADDPTPPVSPAHCLGLKGSCAAPCPPAPCPAPVTPKIEVIMSQPEVRVVAPSRGAGEKCKEGGASCEKGSCGHEKGKGFTLLSINCAKFRGPGAAGQETVTTVIPTYATATIPIALQTTRTYTATGEFAAVARREAAFTRADVREAVREALAESARQRGAGPESAALPGDCCSDLKARIERLEKRLDELKQTVDQINQKVGGGK